MNELPSMQFPDPAPPVFGDPFFSTNQFVDEYSEDVMLLLKDYDNTSIDSVFGVGSGAGAYTISPPVLQPVINPVINPVYVEYHGLMPAEGVHETRYVEPSAQMKRGETSSNEKKKRAASNHNEAERKRRGKISEQAEQLYNHVPHIVKGDKTKMTKQVIDYVELLEEMVRTKNVFPFGIMQRLGWMVQRLGMPAFLEIIDFGLAANGMGPFLSDRFGFIMTPVVPRSEFPPPPYLNYPN